MLVSEWPLLVSVTLQARRIRASRQPCLFQLKAAVCVVAIRALHCSFENLVVKRLIELMLRFRMATQAKLRLRHLQHLSGREAGLFCVRSRDEGIRVSLIRACGSAVRRVAVCTANIVAPVFTTTKIVVFLFAGVARQAGFRILLGRSRLERDDFLRVALFRMRLAGSVTGFAANHFPFPAREILQTRMCGMGVILKLIFVASLAGLAADVLVVLVFHSRRRIFLFISGRD